ncbi:MAG: DUF1501 domain-containing protein [Lentisphaeraceae bacterium]|nr:DUF1501 domain-containing protein [Lentisphaeraceae bacterium]
MIGKNINRRDFSKAAISGMLGTAMSNELYAKEDSSLRPKQFSSYGAAKKIIYIMLPGGFSQRDSFDPLTGKYPDKYKCKTTPIATNVDDVFFGNLFPGLAQKMDKMCLVKARTTRIGAHGPGQYFVRTAYEKRGADKHPHIGAWMDKMLRPLSDQLPLNFVINASSSHPSNGWLPAKHAPLPVTNPLKGLEYVQLPKGVTDERMNKRMAMSKALGSFSKKYNHGDVLAIGDRYDDALTMMRSKDLEAFDLSKEPKWKREAYGDFTLGHSLLLAKRLVERDVRHVEVTSPVGDPHSNIYIGTPDRYREVDKAISALIEDLDKTGLLKETLVVVASEFGRTPFINEAKGRDHWPSGFSCLLAGAGVKSGHVYGTTGQDGRAIENAINTPDWCATLAHLVGMPWHKTFYSPSLRPFKIGGKTGKPHAGILV